MLSPIPAQSFTYFLDERFMVFFFNFLFQYKDPTFSKKRIQKSFEARFCYLNLNFLVFLFVWSEMSSDGFGGYKE